MFVNADPISSAIALKGMASVPRDSLSTSSVLCQSVSSCYKIDFPFSIVVPCFTEVCLAATHSRIIMAVLTDVVTNREPCK